MLSVVASILNLDHLSLKKRLLPALLLVIPVCAHGQKFPAREVRFIVPYPAGSGMDIVTRMIANELTNAWQQPVVVDNRSGAGGIVGTEIAARARPDGYTLLTGNVATHAIQINIQQSLSYNPVDDFDPVTLIARLAMVMLVHPSIPVKSVKDLIALAKANPGQLTYGSSGPGSPPHLFTERFNLATGINMVHVPYKGSAMILTDLIGGRIFVALVNPLTGLPHVKNKHLKALSVTGAKRLAALPDVPTMTEAGVAGYEAYNWYGVFVPKGVPKGIATTLNSDVVAAVQSNNVSGNITKDGAEVAAGTPDEFAQYISAEIKAIGEVTRKLGLRMD